MITPGLNQPLIIYAEACTAGIFQYYSALKMKLIYSNTYIPLTECLMEHAIKLPLKPSVFSHQLLLQLRVRRYMHSMHS